VVGPAILADVFLGKTGDAERSATSRAYAPSADLPIPKGAISFEGKVPAPVESYIVGLEPVPELDQKPAVTVLERASRAVLLRVASSEVARARRYSRARSTCTTARRRHDRSGGRSSKGRGPLLRGSVVIKEPLFPLSSAVTKREGPLGSMSASGWSWPRFLSRSPLGAREVGPTDEAR